MHELVKNSKFSSYKRSDFLFSRINLSERWYDFIETIFGLISLAVRNAQLYLIKIENSANEERRRIWNILYKNASSHFKIYFDQIIRRKIGKLIHHGFVISKVERFLSIDGFRKLIECSKPCQSFRSIVKKNGS
jgi:hypothetical protein